jgi:hypothetical protein
MAAKPFHLGWFLQGSSVQAWGEPWIGHIGRTWMVPSDRHPVPGFGHGSGMRTALRQPATQRSEIDRRAAARRGLQPRRRSWMQPGGH